MLFLTIGVQIHDNDSHGAVNRMFCITIVTCCYCNEGFQSVYSECFIDTKLQCLGQKKNLKKVKM